MIDQMVHVTLCFLIFDPFFFGFPIWLIFWFMESTRSNQWAPGSALFRLLDQGDGAVTLDEFLGRIFGWQDMIGLWSLELWLSRRRIFVTFINRGETNKRNIIDYLYLFYSILISLYSIFYCILYSIVFYSILFLHNKYFVVSFYLSIDLCIMSNVMFL